MGHLSYKCYYNKGRSLKKDQSKEAHLAKKESDVEQLILMVTTSPDYDETLSHVKQSWYLDSRCSNHMTCNRVWMVNIDKSRKSKVRVADNSTLQVEGIGNVIIKKKNGAHVTIKDVLLVPEMKCNLLSLGQLVEKGFTVTMGNKGQAEILDRNKRLIMRTNICKNRTFQVSLDMVEMQCMKAVKDDENWKWHLRFGHLNFHVLQQLSKKAMISGLLDIVVPEKSCESCIIAKQTRRPFKTCLEMRSKEHFEVVH